MNLSAPREARVKSLRQLASEWDVVARQRDHLIRSGADISYRRVLVPEVIKLAQSGSWSEVLDVGCGTGVLAELLATQARHLIGVDMSRVSIELARQSRYKKRNTEYVAASLERFAERYDGPRFDLVVVNMVLQDAPNLRGIVSGVANVLSPGGRVVITVTHPCFWPLYWRYANAPWFHYEREISIEAPFRISEERKSVGITTHFHRPMAQYLSVLRENGLRIESLREPLPSAGVHRLYSKPWRFPRFLSLRCVRAVKLHVTGAAGASDA